MATKKISEMTAASTIGGTELIPFVQSGVNKTATPDLLLTNTRPQYITFVGSTIRIGVRSGDLVFDKTITATGFAGSEDTDWENIGGVSNLYS